MRSAIRVAGMLMRGVFDVAVGIDLERRVGHAQEAGAFARSADGDERRDFELLRFFDSSSCATVAAVARVLDARVRHVAGVHVVAAALVVGFARAHRADDRQVLRPASRAAASAR